MQALRREGRLVGDALDGSTLAQAEIVRRVFESRKATYNKAADDYALTKDPFQRGRIATRPVTVEGGLVAGPLASGFARGAVTIVEEGAELAGTGAKGSVVPAVAALEGDASTLKAVAPSASKATSKRLAYMGKTPGKASRTGREVMERMKQEGTIIEARDGSLHLVDQSGQDGRVIPLTATDMGHLEDAVSWWNREGHKHGPKADPVRRWMRDPKNYEVQPSDLNRSKGAKLTERYRDPEGEH